VTSAPGYISVLPDLARDTAEDTARLVLAAGLRPRPALAAPTQASARPGRAGPAPSQTWPARHLGRPRPAGR
jgi:hypothetical protein